MSQNETRDGGRPVDALDALRLLPHDGAEVIANAVNASDSPEWAMHVRGYGDHPDGWSAVVTRVVEAADPAADGTEPVAPGERPEVAFARSTEDGRTIRAEDTVRGWLLTEGEDMGDGEFVNGSRLCWITNDQARTLAAAWLPLADWETADAAPGSGGQTGTPGAHV